MNAKRWQKILAYSIVGLVLLFVYAPILVLIVYSFADESAGRIQGFSLDAYRDMFDTPEFMTATLNTLILAVASAFIATIMGTLAAIGLFNMKSKAARAAISAANQIPIVNADIVTGISLMLFFVTLSNIGLKLQYDWLTLIISHTVITTPFVIMSVMPRLRQLNPNTYEAALDLGATPFKATVKVLLPQLFSAMAAGFALAFTLSIDDFVITRYNSTEVRTISTFIYDQLHTQGMPNSLRAFSSILFAVALTILILINVRSRKKAARIKVRTDK